LIGVEGTSGRGGALVNNTVGRAEKNLSSRACAFLSSFRRTFVLVASMRVADRAVFVQNERKVTPERTRRKKGWGGSLVNGAMNAGVFGAALGL
jgi:hypothetical protein